MAKSITDKKVGGGGGGFSRRHSENPMGRSRGGDPIEVTLDVDGGVSGGGGGYSRPAPGPAPGPTEQDRAAAEAAAEAARRAAEEATSLAKRTTLFRSILTGVLAPYGLNVDSITGALKKAFDDGLVSDTPSEAEIMPHLYSNAEFRARFPSIAAQADAQANGGTIPGGGRVMSPAEVIAYESSFAQLARSYGINGYDPKTTAAGLILKDVSINEVDARMGLAAYAATTAPQEFRDEFLAHEGLGPGDLVTYFLDPERARPQIEKNVSTAKMQVWQKQAGLATDWTFSEKVVEQGITDNQAQTAFVKVALLRNAQGGYGETVTETEAKSGVLGMDSKDAGKVDRVVASRQGLFSQGGGAAEDRSGVSGLRKS